MPLNQPRQLTRIYMRRSICRRGNKEFTITENMHQLTWATNSCGNGTRLDVDAREIKVLGSVRVSGARQFEDAEVPVGTVRRGRGR